ncbi:MAG: NAD(P)/FAD-dependent oxidoreductase [Dehalococcoidia bacterium]
MSRQSRYNHLLSPGHLGTLEIRNRLVLAPMGENLSEVDGSMGERMQRFYEERARGGVGLIIIGVGAVAHPAGLGNRNQVGISDDRYIPELTQFTNRIHAQGARVAIQLHHGGKVARCDVPLGRPRWAPSEYHDSVGDLFDNLTDDEMMCISADFLKEGSVLEFHAMTIEDIHTVIGQFADAAERAKRAGFDGVEIHSGHGYLIASFISAAVNQRTDEYGGSLENRCRLLTEVIGAVRERVGRDFPVWCRLDGREFHVSGGISETEAQQVAMLAEKAGADAIHVSAYADSSFGWAFTVAPLVHQRCGFVDLAEGIRQKVSIPVIAVGRIEPDDGERLIREGRVDFIAMARKLIADPDLPMKLAEGRAEDIRPCIACYNCVSEIFLNRPMQCAANPVAGREFEVAMEKAPAGRRILVIGAGPAGMEAARVATLRGHKVVLCEKGPRLGGTLFFASMLYDDNERIYHWLKTQVEKLPIEVRLNTDVTPELVASIKPDAIIVAAGARRELPKIPGVNQSHVMGGDDLRALMTGGNPEVAREKLSLIQRTMVSIGRKTGVADNLSLVRRMTRRWMPMGKTVAIVGGGMVGIELAVFLDERKRNVTVIEEGSKLATELPLPRRWRIVHELDQTDIKVLRQTEVEAIGARDITCVSKDGHSIQVPADTVVIATGVEENTALADHLERLGYEVHLAGDCNGMGYIKGALREGFDLGLSL